MPINDFIKVVDPEVIQRLKDAGFSTYMKEKANGASVFVFAKTPELIRYLESHFVRSDFFNSNRLHF